MRSSTERIADPAKKRVRPLLVVARFALEERCHIALCEGVERVGLLRELRAQFTARRREELRRLREQPELLVQAAQDEERLVAEVRGRIPEGARRTLASAVAVVYGAAPTATPDEVGVDGAAVLARQVPTGLPRGLVKGEVLGAFEGRGHATEGNAGGAVGDKVGSTHRRNLGTHGAPFA